MEMMLEVAMRVMDTEDDKVADMVLKIADDDFTDVDCGDWWYLWKWC